jgi:hypothetical protein
VKHRDAEDTQVVGEESMAERMARGRARGDQDAVTTRLRERIKERQESDPFKPDPGLCV